jgi:hypothetical protein
MNPSLSTINRFLNIPDGPGCSCFSTSYEDCICGSPSVIPTSIFAMKAIISATDREIVEIFGVPNPTPRQVALFIESPFTFRQE